MNLTVLFDNKYYNNEKKKRFAIFIRMEEIHGGLRLRGLLAGKLRKKYPEKGNEVI